jgi:hypothetical protein
VRIVGRGSWFVVRPPTARPIPGRRSAGRGPWAVGRKGHGVVSGQWPVVSAATHTESECGGKRLPPPGPPQAGRGGGLGWGAVVLGLFLAIPAPAQESRRPSAPEERFREATQLVRAGDVQKGIAIYRELAASGAESESLYWNWAQAASSKGALGEALWALLRGREVEGADPTVRREIERLRIAANLDTAELAPDPLGTVAGTARRFHLDALAAVLLIVSLAGHALARALPLARWPVPAAWLALTLGLALAAVVSVGLLAHPAGVVVRRGAPLADAASPSASPLATLREGEVVPILGVSGAYLRIQDSSGARGWVTSHDVWRLDRPPRAEK